MICAGGTNDTGPLRDVCRVGLQVAKVTVQALAPLPYPLGMALPRWSGMFSMWRAASRRLPRRRP